jgi:hypothetical protein
MWTYLCGLLYLRLGGRLAVVTCAPTQSGERSTNNDQEKIGDFPLRSMLESIPLGQQALR